MTALLRIAGLEVAAGDLPVVRGVDIEVARGETVAIVGESGCGKSVSMLSVMRLLSPPLAITAGSVEFDGRDLAALKEAEMREVRGSQIAMVYQDPMTSLNPYMRVGDQVIEALRVHGVDRDEARSRTLEVFEKVGIPDPKRTERSYPHEFSGGMRQRVVIAMALVMRPRLLIADEPTTALDVTIQQQILALVAGLQREFDMTTVWVTHDLGVVARLVQRVVVMYGGIVVEDGPVREIFARPAHPYTARLLASLPSLTAETREPLAQIPGRPPLPQERIEGCPFRPRCTQAIEACAQRPPLVARGGTQAACFVDPSRWR